MISDLIFEMSYNEGSSAKTKTHQNLHLLSFLRKFANLFSVQFQGLGEATTRRREGILGTL